MSNTTIPVKDLATMRALTSPETSNIYYLMAPGMEGPFYYDDGDHSTPENVGTVIVTTTTGNFRMKRIFSPNTIYTSWFDVKGAGPTGEATKIQAAINICPEGGKVVFDRGGFFNISNALNITQAIELDLNGSTFNQTQNLHPIHIESPVLWTNAVSSIAVVPKILSTNGGSIPSNVLEIIFSTAIPNDLSIGDIVKLTADNPIPFVKPSTNIPNAWLGQFLVITAIDPVTTNKRVWTNTVPVYVDKYVKNIQLSKPYAGKFILHNGNFSSDPSGSSTFYNGIIDVYGAIQPEVYNVTILNSYGPGIEYHGCYMPKTDRIFIQNAETDSTINDRVGYGVRDYSSQYGIHSNLQFYNVRHGYTTNQSFVSDAPVPKIYQYGLSMGSVVSDSIGYGCQNATFDTHNGAYDITFSNCHSRGGFVGNNSSGNGFAIRGINIRLNNCTSMGNRIGINIFSQYADYGTSNIYVNGGYFDGYSVPVQLGITTTTINNIFFKDVLIIGFSQDIFIANRTQAIFEACSFELNDPFTARYIEPGISCNFLFKDCLFKSQLSGQTVWLIRFTGTGNTVEIRGGRVQVAAAAIDRLFDANSQTVSTVKVQGLTVTATVTNELINQVADTSFLYSLFFDIPGSDQSSSGNITAELTTGPLLQIQSLLDANIVIYGTLTANITLGTIPDSNVIGQSLTIFNSSTVYTITINKAPNVRLYSDLPAINIGPFQSIQFNWNGTSWYQFAQTNPFPDRSQLINALRGLITENFPSAAAGNVDPVVSQTVYYSLVGLIKGDVITKLNFVTGVASTGASTYCAAGIYDPVSGAKVASTNSTNALDSVGLASLPLTTAYTVPTTQAYYIAILIVNPGTPPKLIRGTAQGGALGAVGSGKRLFGNQTGQTVLPSTASLSNATFSYWMGVS